MSPQELKKEIKTKTLQFEEALEADRPHLELLRIYKEIKQLQFQLLEAEMPKETAPEV